MWLLRDRGFQLAIIGIFVPVILQAIVLGIRRWIEEIRYENSHKE